MASSTAIQGRTATPAIAEVTTPDVRATAIALYFASFNVVGATLGPIIAGVLSDVLATPQPGLAADAVGLHRAFLVVVPLGLVIATVAAWRAAGKDVTYYENIEGGHGGAANNRQAAHMDALYLTFLWQQLGK